jgi:di/tricarboxylate transporter
MGIEALLTLAILALALVLFVTEKFPIDVVGAGALSALVLLGLVTPQEGLAGFASSATLTVAAMFVLSAGLCETGVLDRIARLFVRIARWPWLLLSAMMLIVLTMSAFINNTAAVAIFLPLVITAARLRQINPSKLLIPLSYAAQFGGICTLIGTSTNILVSDIAEQQGVRAFTMFELGQAGLPLALAGVVFLLLFGRWLLPNHPDRSLPDTFGIGDYVTDLRVRAGSPLIGRTLRESRFGEDEGIQVIELLRDEHRLWSRRSDAIRAGDVIRVAAPLARLESLRSRPGLDLDAEFLVSGGTQPPRAQQEMLLVEALVAPHSRLHGSRLEVLADELPATIRVLAVRHRGQMVHGAALDQTLLASGDALLLLAPANDVDQLRRLPELLVLNEKSAEKKSRLRALIACAIMAGVVVVAALDLAPIAIVAITGAALLVASGCLKREQAYAAVQWPVIILLATLIPLGTALDKHGIAAEVAQHAVAWLGGFGPLAVLAAIYLLTAVLTELMSNNATAVLLAPIAVSTAHTLDVSPMPFLVAVAIAASASFATPVGYQTNMMVYQAGSYRFADFMRIGIPLGLLFFVLSMWLIPRFWPF